jgi:hypothetical protein
MHAEADANRHDRHALVIAALIYSALSGIYAVALYRYASDSAGTTGFDSDALAIAFYDGR